MQYIGGTNPENLEGVTSASRVQKLSNTNNPLIDTIHKFKKQFSIDFIKQINSQNPRVNNIKEIVYRNIYDHIVNNKPLLTNTTNNNIRKHINDAISNNIQLINKFISDINALQTNTISRDYYLKANLITCPYVLNLPSQEQCVRYNEKSQP